MDTSQYSVGTQEKYSYVQGPVKGLPRVNSGSAADTLTGERAPNVELYAERWEQGLDIWTGKPLEGIGLSDWENQRKRYNKLE